ncbi:hypothetical protein [Saccharopolyspora cebuensis]|uniref:Secreted protein n=1 Tax=Saccharopolyspora cebuensis TaxID=418759 RepID=A0ABV4CMI6_9PSEU
MCGKAWQTVRAGSFLLFVVLLAVAGPLDAPPDAKASRVVPSEVKSETSEHREGEKLRERLPGATVHRRCLIRHEDRGRVVPWTPECATLRTGCRCASGAPPDRGWLSRSDEFRSERHSPAALQVFRH